MLTRKTRAMRRIYNLTPGSFYKNENFSYCDFMGVNATGCVFLNCMFTGCDFTGANLTRAQIINPISLTGATFHRANLKDSEWRDCVCDAHALDNANLAGSRWWGVEANSQEFTCARLSGSRWEDCQCRRWTIHAGEIDAPVEWKRVDLSFSTINSFRVHVACTLREMSAVHVRLTDSDLRLLTCERGDATYAIVNNCELPHVSNMRTDLLHIQ